MKKYLCMMAAVLVFGALLQGCAISYSSEGMRARVVDAETKRPMVGVTVLAHWKLVYPMFLHGHGHRDMELLEAITDDEGWFQFPAWGPRAIPADMPGSTRMYNASPGLIFFKSGYVKFLTNDGEGVREPSDTHSKSRWDGKTIELQKFTGPRPVYARTVAGLLSGLNFRECIWLKMPRMVIALDQEAKLLDLEGVPNYIERFSNYDALAENTTCALPQRLFPAIKK